MGFDTCARIFLVIINLVFLIIGAAFTTAGVIIKWVPSLYQDNLDQFSALIPDFAGNAALTGVTQASDSAQVFDIGSILGNIAIGLLVFGLFIMIIAVLGLIGACCKQKILLIVYVIIVLVLMLAKLAVLVVYITGYFNTQIRTQLNETIVNDYKGIDDFGYISLSWNFFMQKFQCCGLDGYEDFNYAQNWDNNKTLTVSGYSFSQILTTPVACCVTNGTFPSISIVDTNCTFMPTDTNSNWNTGCWNEFDSIIQSEKIYVYIGFGIVCGFELACAIFGLLIVFRGDKAVV